MPKKNLGVLRPIFPLLNLGYCINPNFYQCSNNSPNWGGGKLVVGLPNFFWAFFGPKTRFLPWNKFFFVNSPALMYTTWLDKRSSKLLGNYIFENMNFTPWQFDIVRGLSTLLSWQFWKKVCFQSTTNRSFGNKW